MYLVRHRDRTSLQHLIIKLLLLKFRQLIIQLRLVDRLANRCTRDGLGDFFAQRMLFSKFLPRKRLVSTVDSASRIRRRRTYIVSSTLSILSLPWICFIASPARSIAARVSLLMFAASMEYICCSNVAICADVCSRVCSCCFFRLRAALAAVEDSQ
jgi:hypothetical protein